MFSELVAIVTPEMSRERAFGPVEAEVRVTHALLLAVMSVHPVTLTTQLEIAEAAPAI